MIATNCSLASADCLGVAGLSLGTRRAIPKKRETASRKAIRLVSSRSLKSDASNASTDFGVSQWSPLSIE